MASALRCPEVSEDELDCLLDSAIPENTKTVTKCGIKIFQVS